MYINVVVIPLQITKQALQHIAEPRVLYNPNSWSSTDAFPPGHADYARDPVATIPGCTFAPASSREDDADRSLDNSFDTPPCDDAVADGHVDAAAAAGDDAV